MVRGPDLFQGSVRVEVVVRARIIAAVKIGVVLLLAVIRQRLAGNLPSGDATTIRERRDK